LKEKHFRTTFRLYTFGIGALKGRNTRDPKDLSSLESLFASGPYPGAR